MKIITYFLLLALFSLGSSAQIITIPDAAFKNKLLAASTSNGIAKNSVGGSIKIDINNNSEIEVGEALSVSQLDVSTATNNTINDIYDLEGIQNFLNLKILNCDGNQITSLNLNNLILLENIHCGRNNISSLNINGLVNLKSLFCYYNSLTSLNVNGLTNLETLFCQNNAISTLDLSGLNNIKYVLCNDNQLTNFNIANVTSLSEIVCANNNLNSIDLSGLINLHYLNISNNNITSINLLPIASIIDYLDCSLNPISSINVTNFNLLTYLGMNSTLVSSINCSQSGVTQLFCSDNPNLTSINVKNNVGSTSDPDMLFFAFRFDNLPLLTSICVDAGEENNLAYTNYNSSGNVIIYTGPTCSTVVTMKAAAFEFSNYFTLYPIPAQNTLTIYAKEPINIQSFAIYNNVGQVIQTVSNPNFNTSNAIDVSQLQAGHYFIKIITDKGKTTAKFIKIK
ncbi:T9SS type A sorting domain-containing protein [Flavobacterium sp. GT3R68]|uniref:T9SS type A sorting domain-containing protein n=1 Tax=Flavobacterium sp. GT3R68 TaxID=2594437 RepID=UPI000F87D70A|nr:T9SS type A sorting domain-containing protein [Flavobacterium sp. GT3R68]RTY87980.1 T9SS type A sorting domain-containing protein [Flavobacterium sp. GSN2]TRW91139.1 T9SS type A sorting domain-containing protein [Flavobacterium sp. GT3R68]